MFLDSFDASTAPLGTFGCVFSAAEKACEDNCRTTLKSSAQSCQKETRDAEDFRGDPERLPGRMSDTGRDRGLVCFAAASSPAREHDHT